MTGPQQNNPFKNKKIIDSKPSLSSCFCFYVCFGVCMCFCFSSSSFSCWFPSFLSAWGTCGRDQRGDKGGTSSPCQKQWVCMPRFLCETKHLGGPGEFGVFLDPGVGDGWWMVAVRCRVPGETCEIREGCSRHLAIFTAKCRDIPHPMLLLMEKSCTKTLWKIRYSSYHRSSEPSTVVQETVVVAMEFSQKKRAGVQTAAASKWAGWDPYIFCRGRGVPGACPIRGRQRWGLEQWGYSMGI